MNVKAQVVVGEFRRLFLQLPGKRNLPVMGNTGTQPFSAVLQRFAHFNQNIIIIYGGFLPLLIDFSTGSLQQNFLDKDALCKKTFNSTSVKGTVLF